MANKVNIEVVSFSSQTVAGSTHTNLTLTHAWAGGTPDAVLIVKLLNPAWCFGSVNAISASGCVLGIYNTYTSSITESIILAALYKD